MARNQTRLLLIVAALGALIVVAASIAVVLLVESDAPGFNAEPTWLKARIAGNLQDAPGSETLLVDPLDLPPLTSELTAALRHAATDPAVEGVYIELSGVGAGWAGVQEIRDALLAVRAAEKPCVVWADVLTTKEYALASPCTIHVAPAGLIFVEGLATTRMYYAETFERYGVSANFEHVGDFKSAVEPYERTGPSEAAQEANDALLDSLYAQLVDVMAEGRGVDAETAQGWLNDPPMTTPDALARGMVDGLTYPDEMPAWLHQTYAAAPEGDEAAAVEEDDESDAPEVSFTSMADYLRDLRVDWKSGSDRVAVIYAEGTIISGSSNQDMFGGSYIGDRTVSAQLRKVREDDRVKAVVLRVNSPGGSGAASDAMWREIELTKAEKPLIISMGDYAASGGYYMSMAGHRIFASPGTITGSIGVFGGKMNLAGVYESFGVHLHADQRGPYALMLSSTKDFDEAERKKFKSFLAGFYDIFTTKAAAGRNMEVEAIHAVAQGRVWTGEQALERGLVDELGGLDAAIAYAANQAELPEYAIQRIPERRGLWEELLEELQNPSKDAEARMMALLHASPTTRVPTETLAHLHRLEQVLADGSPAALLPGDLSVTQPGARQIVDNHGTWR